MASSYRSCLDAAVNAGDSSVAFCCISTGVFGFPAEEAARIAVDTVREWLDEHEAAKKSDTTHSSLIPTVVFNVFLDSDEKIYKELLEL